MKHLKLFENTQQTFWLYCYTVIDGNSQDFYLYPDKESVENHILSVINGEREELSINTGEEYDDYMYFTDVEEALEWYKEEYDDVIISYKEITLEDKVEADEKLKKMRTLRKYNL